MWYGFVALVGSLAAWPPRTVHEVTIPTWAVFQTCLGPGTYEMDVLLPAVRRVITREISRSDEVRSGLGLVKGPPAHVTTVHEEAVCAKALRILKDHLGDLATVSDQVAVVRVQGRYVARYRFQYPPEYLRVFHPRSPNVANFYFDRELTKVHRQTW